VARLDRVGAASLAVYVLIADGMRQDGFNVQTARVARGLSDAAARFQAQRLPDWLPSVRLTGLRAGRGSLTLDVRPDGLDVSDNTTGFRLVRGPAPYPAPDDPRSRA